MSGGHGSLTPAKVDVIDPDWALCRRVLRRLHVPHANGVIAPRRNQAFTAVIEEDTCSQIGVACVSLETRSGGGTEQMDSIGVN
mmetsp:Transcript_14927/g.20234  ORF Transcript_14927/g.20234 Transcript_14927/m.20234 type:complete len:84 (+) Transcript_14927:588-839(+)